MNDSMLCHSLDFSVHDFLSVKIPRTFQKYECIRTIGQGFCSLVMLVRRVPTSEIYACKVVSREFLMKEDLLESFEHELRVMEFLKHPNIVYLKEIVFTSDLIFIIMEYCSNGDLFAYLTNNGPIVEGQSRYLFLQIVNAIKYLHDRNLCHRDLKLENILLDSSKKIKICDFGFCKNQIKDSFLNTICGSPIYAAPEIFTQENYDGFKADIWSLGVVLYAISSGMSPWRSNNGSERLKQMKEKDITFPFGFSPDLRTLILGMLDPNPKTRFGIDDVYWSDWLASVREPKEIIKKHLGLSRGTKSVFAIGAQRKIIKLISASESMTFPTSMPASRKQISKAPTYTGTWL